MAINVDLSETSNPETAGQFQRIQAGPVHMLVLEAKENGGDKGEHVVKLEVLMHPDQTIIGKTHTEWFPASAKMAWKLLMFCYAVKIADRDAMAKQKASGNAYVPIDLKAAEGRQLFGTIKVTEKDGKQFHNLDDMMAIDDPKAANHPRNVGMLNQALGQQPRPLTTGASSSSAAQQQKPAASNPFAAVT
jgi:hypothetical protein